MAFAKRHIRVTLIDADTGEPIAETSTPPAELPENFQGYCTLQVGNATWEVAVAEPTMRREYLQTGTLRLQVRKVETVSIPINELLYSLPTRADVIPEVDLEKSKTGLNILEVVEDDWRQIEILSLEVGLQVAQCISNIGEVFNESRNAAGCFTRVHVRSELNQPFPSPALRLKEIASELQGGSLAAPEVNATAGPVEFQGLSYRNLGGLIKNGFALRTKESLYIYGTTDGAFVTTLGLLRCRTAIRPAQDAHCIAKLMERHKLMLVDWCNRQMISAESAADYICEKVAYQVE